MARKLNLKEIPGFDEQLVFQYCDEQKPMHEIAQRIGCTPATIYYHLKRLGIKTRKKEEVFSFKGHKHSQRVVDIIKKTHEGKKVSKETREKIAKSKLGTRSPNWNGGKRTGRADGYIQVYRPEHPNASKEGYVMEHRLVMERVLGRYLDNDEVVHHINSNRSDNRPSNLMCFRNGSDHMKYHSFFKKEEKKCSIL